MFEDLSSMHHFLTSSSAYPAFPPFFHRCGSLIKSLHPELHLSIYIHKVRMGDENKIAPIFLGLQDYSIVLAMDLLDLWGPNDKQGPDLPKDFTVFWQIQIRKWQIYVKCYHQRTRRCRIWETQWRHCWVLGQETGIQRLKRDRQARGSRGSGALVCSWWIEWCIQRYGGISEWQERFWGREG